MSATLSLACTISMAQKASAASSEISIDDLVFRIMGLLQAALLRSTYCSALAWAMHKFTYPSRADPKSQPAH